MGCEYSLELLEEAEIMLMDQFRWATKMMLGSKKETPERAFWLDRVVHFSAEIGKIRDLKKAASREEITL
jgi:hypothetical protein